MKKKLIVFGIVGAIAFYFFLYTPPLPSVGSYGRIGKKFKGTWDGTTATLDVPVTNQNDTTDIFNHYPAVKTIIDSQGTTFTRG
jgi:hypothetical protein